MSSSDEESSHYSEDSSYISEEDMFKDIKAKMPPYALQEYIGQKYSFLSSLPFVKAIARKCGHRCKTLGNTKVLGKHTRHGRYSLDCVILKAIDLVRTISPDWDLQILRLETVSKKQKLVPVLPNGK